MKFKILRNISVKRKIKQGQIQVSFLKNIVKNTYFPFHIRWEARLFLSILSQNANRSRSKRYCFLTGRNRGFIRYSGLSRIKTRELSRNRALASFSKNSW